MCDVGGRPVTIVLSDVEQITLVLAVGFEQTNVRFDGSCLVRHLGHLGSVAENEIVNSCDHVQIVTLRLVRIGR